MRLLAVFVLTVLLCSQVAGQSDGCTPATGEPLPVGVVFPPDSLFGRARNAPYQGIQAMAAALNGCGGANGRPIELVAEMAANHDEAMAAVSRFSGQVPLVIGSGNGGVRDVLASAAASDTFFYWDVTDGLDAPHGYALSLLASSHQLGAQTSSFVHHLGIDDPFQLAFVSGDQPQVRSAAGNVRDGLALPLELDRTLTGAWQDNSSLAVQLREQHIDVMVVVALEREAAVLRTAMREADANVPYWIQVGGEYPATDCASIGSLPGLMTVGRLADAHPANRPAWVDVLDLRYRAAYAAQFGGAPDAAANLAASSFLLMFGGILADVDVVTPVIIQEAAMRADLDAIGLMGEGWRLNHDTYANEEAIVFVQQRQQGAMCILAPEALATCRQPAQPMPTWREQAQTSYC